MNLLTALDVNASGLTAQRRRVEVASSNLANSQTTRTEDGGPYRRKDVVFQTTSFGDSLGAAMQGGGVQGVEVSQIVELGKESVLAWLDHKTAASSTRYSRSLFLRVRSEMPSSFAA